MFNSIKSLLLSQSIDGWLSYDFRGNNKILLSLLKYPLDAHLTRRFFLWIPSKGDPIAIVHRIDEDAHTKLNIDKFFYSTWQELEAILNPLVNGKKIAMEYWPHGAIPTFSIVDAGTFEWISSMKTTILSSWPIVGSLLYTLSERQQKSHLEAAQILEMAVQECLKFLHLKRGCSEYDLQLFLINYLTGKNLIFDHPPIIAFGSNGALPHYEVDRNNKTIITQDNVLLIDLWGKLKDDHAIYADLTKVFYIGSSPSQYILNAYQALVTAQKATIELIMNSYSSKTTCTGAELDRTCRNEVIRSGFGEYFTHRTGHNITETLHGPGPNLDSYETLDERSILPSSCFSIEPGIYIPGKFGLRTECNILIRKDFQITISGKAEDFLRAINLD